MSAVPGHVMLVWSAIPDYTTVYLFPETHPDVEMIKACHSMIIKGGDDITEELETLSKKLGEETGVDQYQEFAVVTSAAFDENDDQHLILRDLFSCTDGTINLTTIVLSGIYL